MNLEKSSPISGPAQGSSPRTPAGLTFSPVSHPSSKAPCDGIACACGSVHGSDDGHSHSGVGFQFQLRVLLPLAIALVILGFGAEFFEASAVSRLLGLAATLVAGGPIVWTSIQGLSRGKTNVNELVAMSMIGAIWMGWPLEAGLVALILQIGALIEHVATENAHNAVLELQKLAPVHARIRRNDQDQIVEVAKLQVGDVLVIQAGERIAADGLILSGSTSTDESMVTGEAVPVEKEVGRAVLAGTMNLTGSIQVQVQKVGEHSALGQTIALVRRAQQFQPALIRAADRFFAFYTPAILGLSLIVLWVTNDPVRMVTMWVVGCPCAMLLASPLAIVVSMARASRSGIQVKAGPFVEASASVDTIVFDKTGTLTTGQFVVSAIRPAPGIAERDLLALAATVESRSSHPLARAIVQHARQAGVSLREAADVRVREGLGVEVTVGGENLLAGSLKIVPADQRALAGQLEVEAQDLPMVPVYLVRQGQLLGLLALTDQIRPEAARTIQRLRNLGLKRVVMLTGDRRRTAEMVGRSVGCDEVHAELLPSQKVELIRQYQKTGKGVVMVGDGINDAPSLAAAAVGIAMGVRGTDVAIEAADAILLKDDLTRVPLLIYLARQTRTAIYQNLGFSLVFAGAAEAAAAAGLFGPVVAAAVHIAGVVVIAVNSVRLAGTPQTRRAVAAESPAGVNLIASKAGAVV